MKPKANKPNKPKPFNIFTRVQKTRQKQNAAYNKLLKRKK